MLYRCKLGMYETLAPELEDQIEKLAMTLVKLEQERPKGFRDTVIKEIDDLIATVTKVR